MPIVHFSSPHVAKCSAHLFFRDFVTLIIIVEDEISYTSVLYNFLQSPLTSPVASHECLGRLVTLGTWVEVAIVHGSSANQCGY